MDKVEKPVLKFSNFSSEAALISICIPTYNRVELLKQALQSAVRQIHCKTEYEIIIVSNSDNQQEINELIPILGMINTCSIYYYQHKKNVGMFGNWNSCIKLASGDYLTILSDDDLLDEEFVCSVTPFLYKQEIIMSNFNFLYGVGNHSRHSRLKHKIKTLFPKNKITLKELYWGNPTPGLLGALIKKGLLLELDAYDKTYGMTADYDLWHRALKKSNAIYISKPLAYYRIFENESFNQSTLRDFIINNFKIRFEIANECQSLLFKLMLNPMSYSDTLALRRTRNSKISVTKASEMLNREFTLFDKLCGYTLYFIRPLIRIFNKVF